MSNKSIPITCPRSENHRLLYYPFRENRLQRLFDMGFHAKLVLNTHTAFAEYRIFTIFLPFPFVHVKHTHGRSAKYVKHIGVRRIASSLIRLILPKRNGKRLFDIRGTIIRTATIGITR